MKNIFILTLLIVYNFCLSQKIHVKYLHIRSEIATLYEDLYIDENKVLSRQDSLIQFKNLNSSDGNITAFRPGKSTRAFYFISTINDENKRDFFFTSAVNGNDPNDNYFIHDNVIRPVWIIDKKSTKKIAGYHCIKATANFRGSDITAYFTEDLPYSVGPFKFFGLPGLILDVRHDNKSFNIWRAEKVELDYKEKIDFTPSFKQYQRIEIKKFIDLKDKLLLKNNKEVLNSLPSDAKIQYSSNRLGIEKVFEWETK